MKNQHEILRDELFHEIISIQDDTNIQRALNKKLPNDSTETDYVTWLEASKKFAESNKEMLKAWAN